MFLFEFYFRSVGAFAPNARAAEKESLNRKTEKRNFQNVRVSPRIEKRVLRKAIVSLW